VWPFFNNGSTSDNTISAVFVVVPEMYKLKFYVEMVQDWIDFEKFGRSLVHCYTVTVTEMHVIAN
jgi:hypothetical protein